MGMNSRIKLAPNLQWCMMRNKPPLELPPNIKARVKSVIEDENLDDVLTMDDGSILYRTEHGWLSQSDYDWAMRGRHPRYQKTLIDAWKLERENKS